jgi:biotin-(acetyl-CoA carboxylase) ligase
VFSQLERKQDPGKSVLSTIKRTRSRYKCPLNYKEKKIQLRVASQNFNIKRKIQFKLERKKIQVKEASHPDREGYLGWIFLSVNQT